MPSSVLSTWSVMVPSSSRIGTGMASWAKCPESVAAAARRWLSSAYSSMSWRVIFHWSASSWATRNCIHSRPSMTSRNDFGKGPVPPRALEASGTRLMDSTPQAMARS